jgi:hypothetical protein
MAAIDVFYQGEGIREVEHLEVAGELTFGELKVLLIKKHGLDVGVILFLEDADDPIDERVSICEHRGPHGLKVHMHRCRHIAVSVTFNGETVEHRFAPGATVARVKQWAAERKFGMTPAEASEHVLQISGTHDRPAPITHLGAIPHGKDCRLAFDLVPDERVNG